MTEEEYLKERVENQIDWYDSKSILNKNYYNRLKFFEILLALSIPLLSGFISSGTEFLKYAIGLIGFLVAGINGILNLFKFHEKWTEYRTVSETLKHEKYLYLTRKGIYNSDLSYNRFVERIEGHISKENTNWSQYVNDQKLS